ncbi:amidohydrolase [Mariniluteicoccus flavus]
MTEPDAPPPDPATPDHSTSVVLTGLHLLDRPGLWAVALSGGFVVAVTPAEYATTLGLPVMDARPSVGERALLTGGFVDAHAHVLLTGRGMAGLDLAHVHSVTDLLAAVAQRRAEAGPLLITGQGWDHTEWPEGRPATMAELDRAADGAPVLLTRVEVHSALVSSALVDRVPGLRDADGFDPSGWITREAFGLASKAVAGMFTDSQRESHVEAALRAATAKGIVSVHEMGAPHLNTPDELLLTRRVAARLGVDLPAYWGEEASPEIIGWAVAEGLHGLGGDLNADGAIGSRTACVSEGYHDHPVDDAGGEGFLYLDAERAAAHVIACTRAGLQAGFHCIGDRGVATSVEAMRRAADACGAGAIRRARHRLEHVEMASDRDIATMAELGIWASMQPLFDAWWGMPGGLYEQRLGARYTGLNRFATMQRAGVRLAFGSDAPVTPFHGWEVVRAATLHWQEGERLDVHTAYAATGAAGHELAHGPHGERYAAHGAIAVGAPADLALWACEDVGDDGWPALNKYATPPACAATWARGRLVHDDRALVEELP